MNLRPFMKIKGAVALAVASALAAAAVWLLWPGSPAPVSPDARTRTTIDVTVCLLTGPGGAVPPTATAADAAAWQGILAAQQSTNLRAQKYPVTGGGTVKAAQTAINTLALRGCGLIITTGSPENAAATSQSHLFPKVEFAPESSASPATITADAESRALALVKNSS